MGQFLPCDMVLSGGAPPPTPVNSEPPAQGPLPPFWCTEPGNADNARPMQAGCPALALCARTERSLCSQHPGNARRFPLPQRTLGTYRQPRAGIPAAGS